MNSRNHRKAGDWVPEVAFPVYQENQWTEITSTDVFDRQSIILFALTGAFASTCSSCHLPGYAAHADSLRRHGIDEVYCLSVNDWCVMEAWRKQLGIGDQVKMLPDGNADFTRGMGMLVSRRREGFGERSWRYSMVVRNRVIEAIFPEDISDAGDPFSVSSASHLLAYLKRKAQAVE